MKVLLLISALVLMAKAAVEDDIRVAFEDIKKYQCFHNNQLISLHEFDLPDLDLSPFIVSASLFNVSLEKTRVLGLNKFTVDEVVANGAKYKTTLTFSTIAVQSKYKVCGSMADLFATHGESPIQFQYHKIHLTMDVVPKTWNSKRYKLDVEPQDLRYETEEIFTNGVDSDVTRNSRSAHQIAVVVFWKSAKQVSTVLKSFLPQCLEENYNNILSKHRY